MYSEIEPIIKARIIWKRRVFYSPIMKIFKNKFSCIQPRRKYVTRPIETTWIINRPGPKPPKWKLLVPGAHKQFSRAPKNAKNMKMFQSILLSAIFAFAFSEMIAKHKDVSCIFRTECRNRNHRHSSRVEIKSSSYIYYTFSNNK